MACGKLLHFKPLLLWDIHCAGQCGVVAIVVAADADDDERPLRFSILAQIQAAAIPI